MQPAFKSETTEARIGRIQKTIQQNGLDGWLMFSFRRNNPLVGKILDLPSHLTQMRRFFYYIPADGTPRKLVHAIERGTLDSLPGEKIVFSSWQDLEAALKTATGGAKRIAMEYSPECAIPYVSIVDAGTIEMVRKATGADIISSADLIQFFDSTWDDEQLEFHLEASRIVIQTAKDAFTEIKNKLLFKQRVTEYDIQQFILRRFRDHGLTTEHLPNCSVNEHSGDPHYEPTEAVHKEIRVGDFVLIDLWAKKDAPRGVYADYTWVGFAGDTVPEKYEKVFQVVKGARDAAVAFIKKEINAGKDVYGWQVDDVCRGFIKSKGYGDFFTHRTGHSIGEDVHGNGANIDNLETRDNRKLIPRTCFSIEPGVYFFNDFGVRSEINVYLTDKNDILVTGTPLQQEVLAILK